MRPQRGIGATLWLVVIFALVLASCGGAADTSPYGDGGVDGAREAAIDCTLPRQLVGSAYRLRYDQVGYDSGGARWAVLVSPGLPATGYRVYDVAAQCFVGGGTSGPRVLDTTSRAGTRLTGDRVDLSSMQAGNYLVVLDDGTRFGPIPVAPAVHARVLAPLLDFFAAQRCGPTTQAISHHGPCHLFASIASAHSGDGVAVNDGYTGPVTAATGPAVDVEGGWHDAGDYLKFVGTTSYVLAVELVALRDHGAVIRLGAGGLSNRAALGPRLAAGDGGRRRAVSSSRRRGRSRRRLSPARRRHDDADRRL
jgi:hypothetical protein